MQNVENSQKEKKDKKVLDKWEKKWYNNKAVAKPVRLSGSNGL